jgi:hypothetical protein
LSNAKPSWVAGVIAQQRKKEVFIRMVPRWADILQRLLQTVQNGLPIELIDLNKEEQLAITAYLESYKRNKGVAWNWVLGFTTDLMAANSGDILTVGNLEEKEIAEKIVTNLRPNLGITVEVESSGTGENS